MAVLEEECATLVEYIPAGVTGLCQLMIVAVMKAYKERCRSLYVKSSIAHGFDGNASARCARIAHHIIQAWEYIPEASIRKGFVQSGYVSTGPRAANGLFLTDSTLVD